MSKHLVAYINAILISNLAESKEKALNHAKCMVYLLECLGFVVNKEKSVHIPSQTIEFLGLMINITNMEFQLLLHKIKIIQAESRIDNTTAVAYTNQFLGRYNLLGSCRPDKESLDVVPGKEYPHHSATPPIVT